MASVPTSVCNYEIFRPCISLPGTLPLLHPKFCILISPLHYPLLQTRWVLGSPATLSRPHLYMLVLWVPVLCPHKSICVSSLIFIPHRHCLISCLHYLSSGSFLEPSDLAAPLGPLKSVFRCLLQEILLKCTAPDVTAFGCLIKNRRSLTESPQTMSSLWFLLPCWSSTEPAPDAGKCRTSNVSCCPIPEDLAQLSVRLGCNLFPHLLLKPFFIYRSHFILCKGFPDPAWRIQAQSAAFPRRKDISL